LSSRRHGAIMFIRFPS